jgi:hypothetical protein
MKTRLYYTFVVGTAIAMSNMRAPAQAHNPAAITEVTDPSTPSPTQRALRLLKPVADKLSTAKAFTFKVQSMVEVPSPEGQVINCFFQSELAIQRPNKLAIKKTGHGPAFDLFYDGKTFSGVDQRLGLYAQMDAPDTLDELLPGITEKTGIYFPFADVLSGDLYGNLTKDLTHACCVDKSAVDGLTCDHLGFAAPGVEFQVWVGPEQDPLPRRLMVTMLKMERQPRCVVTFSNWDLAPTFSDGDFELKKPDGAKQIEFRPLVADSQA